MQLNLQSLLIESNNNRMGLEHMSRHGTHLLGSKAFKLTCVHMREGGTRRAALCDDDVAWQSDACMIIRKRGD